MRFLDLHDLLMSERVPETSMVISGLDGFLTGLACSPEPIPPEEWFPVIWGADGTPQFDDTAEAKSVHGAIVGRLEEIARALDTGRAQALDPIFWTTPDDRTLAADWAEGFMQAVRLRPDAWQPLLDDAEGITHLAPILTLSTNAEGNSPFDLSEPRLAEIYDNAPDLIPSGVIGIDHFWGDRASREPRATAREPRRVQKVGRNAPCPCGSGQKYKKCCGA